MDPVLSRIDLSHDAPPVWLVGGAVRDALLGIAHGPDVDLVVEGDAIALAREIGHSLGGRVIAHPRFRTARIEFAHGRHLDLVTARQETYAEPGALPDVTPGSLEDDLARRDFTVNAIAHGIHGPSTGFLADPHGGREDIAAERIRVIREGSFEEDPSRVVRALRYAARLGFRMEEGTETEARYAAPAVDLSRPRVADEMIRLLEEDAAPRALRMASALGLAWPDDDPLRDTRLGALAAALARPGAPAPDEWALRLGIGVMPGAVARAAVPAWARAVAREVRAGLDLARVLLATDRPSEVDDLLHDRSPAEQVGALVGGAEVVATWWSEWRDAAPAVTGSDLVAAGVPAGPAIGRALRAVRAAMLDGRVGDRDGQLALALKAAAEV